MLTEDVESRFNEGYLDARLYEQVLPPHFYCGLEDTEVVGALLRGLVGAPDGDLGPCLDIGCGPGRMTQVLAPYASTLLGADKSAGMTQEFGRRFPDARVLNVDTEALVPRLLDEGLAGTFALIGSFWSLSYPLLECFEELDSAGVVVVGDEAQGRARAAAIIDGLVDLLAPDGMLLGLFFDADSAEQRFVTELWEEVHPFPGTGRRFTWELLHERLTHHDRAGTGRLLEMRLPGTARLDNIEQARDWFEIEHLNSYAPLVRDPRTRARIDEFAAGYTTSDGAVILPSGVNVFAFQRTTLQDAPAMRGFLAHD